MIGEPWLYWFAGGLVAIHLLVFLYAHVVEPDRFAGRPGNDRASESANANADGPGNGDVVECPACGATNRSGYRFCRGCVDELPGGHGTYRGTAAPSGRGIL